MKANKAEFRITFMASILGVPRSGFYRWMEEKKQGKTVTSRQPVDQIVSEIFVQKKCRYGARRLINALCESGIWLNRKTIAASLKR